MGASSSSPSASVPKQGKARMFSCHAFLPKSDAVQDVVVDNSTIKGGGNPQLKMKNKGGKSTKYAFGCICQGRSEADVQSYYSKDLHPIIQKTVATNFPDEQSSVLLLTIGRKGSGKSAVLYGHGGTAESGLSRLICQDLLEMCSGAEQCKLFVSLIRSDGSKSQVAYDCLAKSDNSSGLLLTSIDNAKAAAEMEIDSLKDFDKSVLQIGASAGKAAHTLLVFKVRNEGSGSTKQITCKILDLHGDMPPITAAKKDGKGKTSAKSSKGGRGGRKGGRGWSSYDTRNGGSIPSDEDPTNRAIRRVIDYLARRFHNVPYKDSLFTSLLQSDFEKASILPIVALVCVGGDGGSGGDAPVLDFVKKLREIAV